MNQIRQFLQIFLNRKFFKKLFAYGLLIGLIFALQGFIGIFILTFIFAYLAYSSSQYLYELLEKRSYICAISEKFYRYINVNVIVVLEYILFISIIIFVLQDMLPRLVNELGQLSISLPFLSSYIEATRDYLQVVGEGYTKIGGTVEQVFASDDYLLVTEIFAQLKTAGAIFLQIILSLVLSFIFIIDRDKLASYLSRIEESNFKFLYAEYSIIFEKVVKSFGLILRAQAMIALVNAILTSLGLFIIGLFFGALFPFLLTLALIVFIFGFVPVLGFFISSIPILFVAYSTFGMPAVIAAVLMIAIIHMIEAYYLNPKIVSSYLELPVSMTFVILLVSEHIFGLAGLLVGVSLFSFSMGLLGDMNHAISTTKKKMSKK